MCDCSVTRYIYGWLFIIVYCRVYVIELLGHKSFIGCLACSKDGNIVTGGWDGCIMTWTLPKEALTVAAENPELQDEPNTVFKTGTHTSVELLPSGIWNLDTNMLICLYRQQKEKTTLVFYC